MNEQIFWELINQSSRGVVGDLDAQHEILVSKLSEYMPEEILEFNTILNRYHVKSYTSELWAAAYLINGGCSDDGFDYFRGWLISKGRKAYEDALKNPESLADIISEEEEVEFEDFLYVANDAYKIHTGKDDFCDKVKSVSWPAIELTWNEDEEELAEMFPKLAMKFL